MSDPTSPDTLCYLATPYTKVLEGIDFAFRAAARLTGLLLRARVKCYSPIVHGHAIAMHAMIDPLDHSIWLPFDETMMRRCDVLLIAHMPGWEESKGIAHEIEFFTKARKPIWDVDPATLTMTRRKSVIVRERYEGLDPDEMRRIANSYLHSDGNSDDRTPAGTLTAPT